MKFCPNAVALLNAFQDVCPVTKSICCTALFNSPLSNRLVLPDSPLYEATVNNHFATNAPLHPACFLQPETAEDVSQAVSLLVETDDGSPQCQFAVRSGGHATWAGASGTRDGVTIDLSQMNSTIYNENNSTASIMTGARWGSVYKTLKPHGVAVTGGRDDTLGVGGVLMGGRFSFFAARYGLLCDNVENYEVVLASGEIVNANAQSNTDLFRALKGGSNNFGIITKIDLRTFEQGDLWGGIIAHDLSTTTQQISALVNFTNNVADDPHASLVSIWQYSSALGKIAASGMQYTKPVERPAAYREFLQIPSIADTFRFTDIFDLMKETAPPGGNRVRLLTLTFGNDERVLRKLLDVQDELIEEVRTQVHSKGWDVVSFLQPLPKLIGEFSERNGGNVLPLNRMDKNHLLYLSYISWDDSADDALFHNTGDKLISRVSEYAKSINEDNDFIYMNYADKVQNPLRSYGEENLQHILRVARKYDPTGVFQVQAPGGYKASAA